MVIDFNLHCNIVINGDIVLLAVASAQLAAVSPGLLWSLLLTSLRNSQLFLPLLSLSSW
jgi:hypothetical protein